MTMTQGELLQVIGPAGKAVIQWGIKLHGRKTQGHEWAIEVAWLMHDHGPDTDLPPFPATDKATRTARERTARRVFRQPPKPAKRTDPAYLPSVAVAIETRDYGLSMFRDHQASCQHCASSGINGPDDLPTGQKARLDFICDKVVCTEGSILLHRPMQYQTGLRAGLYPERGERKTAPAAKAAPSFNQLDLFEHVA